MNTVLRFITALIISTVSLSTFSQPTGVGPADVQMGYCVFSVIVDTSTDPSYRTVLNVVDVEDNQMVLTNSKKGNANLNCSGKLDRNATVVGTDVLVSGEIIEGMPVSFEEGCDFLKLLGADACSGNGGTFKLNYEITGGVTCDMPVEGGYRASMDWRQITTPSGRLKLYCHWNRNKDTFVPD